VLQYRVCCSFLRRTDQFFSLHHDFIPVGRQKTGEPHVPLCGGIFHRRVVRFGNYPRQCEAVPETAADHRIALIDCPSKPVYVRGKSEGVGQVVPVQDRPSSGRTRNPFNPAFVHCFFVKYRPGPLHAAEAYRRRVPGVQPQQCRFPVGGQFKQEPVRRHIERRVSRTVHDYSEFRGH
jgi:hypothetical protein